MLLSIDPGKNIGFARWSEAGTLLETGIWTFDEMVEYLDREQRGISWIVYEDFIMYAHMANGRQTGSRFEASQAIGAIRSIAKRAKIKLTRQAAGILTVSALHAGVKVPKGHMPDDMSAMLHGHYYLMGLKIRPDIASWVGKKQERPE